MTFGIKMFLYDIWVNNVFYMTFGLIMLLYDIWGNYFLYDIFIRHVHTLNNFRCHSYTRERWRIMRKEMKIRRPWRYHRLLWLLRNWSWRRQRLLWLVCNRPCHRPMGQVVTMLTRPANIRRQATLVQALNGREKRMVNKTTPTMSLLRKRWVFRHLRLSCNCLTEKY